MGGRRPHTPVEHRRPTRSRRCRSQPGRVIGPSAILAVTSVAALVSVAVLVIASSCSREVTHRVLTFLYDGVPPLEAGPVQPEIELAEAGPAGAAEGGAPGGAEAKKSYSHPAYRKNLCGGCHDVDGGRLLKTAREGLCQTCHPDKPAKKKFVHGPVAVNGCLACHHFHKAPFPKVLIADAQSLCFRCHVTEELATDRHHATIKEERCIVCHDAHGGDDRFFLLPGAVREIPP